MLSMLMLGLAACPQSPVSPPNPPAADAAPLSGDRLGSPLADVWQAVGNPSSLHDQRCVQAQILVQVFGHDGRVLATFNALHQADLSEPDRDRLVLRGGELVHGRAERSAPWTEVDGVPRKQPAPDAVAQLDLFGLLLRAPWVFAEPGFAVSPPRRVRREETDYEVIDIVNERPAAAEGEGGARDVFELWCEPETMLPLELRYALAGRTWRRVRFSQYQTLGWLRFPVRRTVLSDNGVPLIDLEVKRMSCQQQIPLEKFRAVQLDTPAAPR